MSKKFFLQCGDCKEPTKRITGFWDGKSPITGKFTHGCFYDCSNTDCPVKQMSDEFDIEAKRRKFEVQEENKRNGVDIGRLKKSRITARYSICDIADKFNISTSLYSSWENERLAIPYKWYRFFINIFE